jgi:hypothetical protein
VGGYGFDALRCLRGWMRHAAFVKPLDMCTWVKAWKADVDAYDECQLGVRGLWRGEYICFDVASSAWRGSGCPAISSGPADHVFGRPRVPRLPSIARTLIPNVGRRDTRAFDEGADTSRVGPLRVSRQHLYVSAHRPRCIPCGL